MNDGNEMIRGIDCITDLVIRVTRLEQDRPSTLWADQLRRRAEQGEQILALLQDISRDGNDWLVNLPDGSSSSTDCPVKAVMMWTTAVQREFDRLWDKERRLARVEEALAPEVQS